MFKRGEAWKRGGKRGRWPLVLLLGSVAAIAFAAHQVYGTLGAQREVVDVLSEYSGFAAWSYRQRLSDRLVSVAVEVVGAVNHGPNLHTSPHIPHASELGHYLPWNDECYCHRPERGPLPAALFGFGLGADTVGIGINRFETEDSGWLVDLVDRTASPPESSMAVVPPMPASANAARFGWIADTLGAAIRGTPHQQGGYWWRIAEFGDTARYLVYTLMPTAWGDTIVYGAEYGASAFAGMLEDVLDGELLPPTFTRELSNRDVLGLSVTTSSGRPVLEAGVASADVVSATARLTPALSGLGIRMWVRPGLAQRFVIGGLPRDRLPFLAGLLALSAALAVVALTQVRRETELARTRSEFVSSISHELRTPLAQIRLQLEMLRLGRARDDAARDRSLAQIDREASRLGQLVDNVLLYSRGATQALAGPSERVDAGAAVGRIVAEYAPLAASRRASIEVDAAAAMGRRAALRLPALRHILVNLLDNAVKYGPAGQTVRVRAEVDADVLRVIVRDEGPGVTEEEQRHVFEPFRRGRSRAARGSGGSGIGLTLVRDLVQAQEGRVWVDAGPGGAIGFELPASELEARA